LNPEHASDATFKKKEEGEECRPGERAEKSRKCREEKGTKPAEIPNAGPSGEKRVPSGANIVKRGLKRLGAEAKDCN